MAARAPLDLQPMIKIESVRDARQKERKEANHERLHGEHSELPAKSRPPDRVFRSRDGAKEAAARPAYRDRGHPAPPGFSSPAAGTRPPRSPTAHFNLAR